MFHNIISQRKDCTFSAYLLIFWFCKNQRKIGSQWQNTHQTRHHGVVNTNKSAICKVFVHSFSNECECTSKFTDAIRLISGPKYIIGRVSDIGNLRNCEVFYNATESITLRNILQQIEKIRI